MARNSGAVLFILALSFGCRKKEIAPPIVADPPRTLFRLDQPVVVNNGPDKPGGQDQPAAATSGQAETPTAAVDETARREKLSKHAAEQQAPVAKMAKPAAELTGDQTAEQTHTDRSAKTGPARSHKSRRERSAGTAVAAALEPVPAAPAAAAEPAPSHAILNFKNDAGGDFRLVDARFLMDGADLPSAITSAERGKTYVVFSGDVGAGRHLVTAHLTYQGATHGVFSYMKGYSFKVSSDEVLTTHSGRAATFTIICKERKGFNEPAQQRLVVSLEEHGAGTAAP